MNPILDTDSYKASHWLQMPPGTTSMFSYFESRGSDLYDQCMFFGLQYLLKEYLTKPIRYADVCEARDFFADHGLPFNSAGWHRVVDLGHLPIRIRAVPEGTIVPNRNVLMTIESTDPKTFWVVNWLETMLVRLWYPITVATRSWYVKHMSIIPALERSSDLDPQEASLFMLHDFGSRGSTSQESAGIGGLAHLLNFRGSDTVMAPVFGRKFYGEPMASFSIPAMEHATVTAWGEEIEEEAYRNMLSAFGKPGALVAFVSDSYDIYNAVDNIWGKNMKQAVLDSGAVVVIRPDSGDPLEVVPRILRSLAASFGTTENSRGYKVLNSVRVIQGDGMNENTVRYVLAASMREGFSVENLAFGMGGGLLQDLNRDTLQFAFKCSSIVVDGQEREVSKNPATDPEKASKPGRLDLVREDGKLVTRQLRWGLNSLTGSVMRTVYEDGELLVDDDLSTIRARTGTRAEEQVPA